mmetsp:Transcript_10683/g.24340  ORF Transcript_10683/g.24340 Transcript_10683/m.24340 type:complete len:685 (-) Transcript_10683:111-2165(-)
MARFSCIRIAVLSWVTLCLPSHGSSVDASGDSCAVASASGQSLLQLHKDTLTKKSSSTRNCRNWCYDDTRSGHLVWAEKCGMGRCETCPECATTTTTTRPPFPECTLQYQSQVVSDGSLTISSGEQFQASVSSAGTASYKFELAPAGLSVNMRTGALHWQPDASQTGAQYGVLAITDNAGALSRCLVSVTVAPGPHGLPFDALYVAPLHGSDSNDGSIDTPFASVEKAAKEASPGDVIYVRGGRYTLGTDDIVVNATPSNPVVITRLPGERVQFDVATNKIGFKIPGWSVGVTFRGFEMYGASETNNHWEVLRTSWWRVQDVRVGGKTAFEVDGYHVVVEECIIHDMDQKAVNIYKGRYVTVRNNIIYNIGHASLSGGHGIMRKWERNYGKDDPDDLAYYRWDFYGNLIFGVEQRIYSFIPWKGYCEMVIDEGKGILIDITKDDVMKARIAHNLVLYGGVDHIRLKMNPNMEVHNNAVFTEEGKEHPIPDGITCKNNDPITNLTLVGNLVQSFAGSFPYECGDHIDDSAPAERFRDNYFAGGGATRGTFAAITDLGATASVFKDPANLDFSKSDAVPAADAGVDPAILSQLFALVQEEGIHVGPTGWRHDHVANVNAILESAPSEHVNIHPREGTPEHGKQVLLYTVTSEWYQTMCDCTEIKLFLPEVYDLARDLPDSIALAVA